MYDPVFVPVLVAYLSCLVAKIITYSWQKKQLTFDRFLRDGGMPSAHTTAVAALATVLFLEDGFSALFWVTVVFGLIVMRDAVGVRRESGNQAKAINTILARFSEGKQPGVKQLREVLGHTPSQVFVGLLFGIVIAWLTYVYVV